jgi:hypothetical protein
MTDTIDTPAPPDVRPQKISWCTGGMIAAVGSVHITRWNLGPLAYYVLAARARIDRLVVGHERDDVVVG